METIVTSLDGMAEFENCSTRVEACAATTELVFGAATASSTRNQDSVRPYRSSWREPVLAHAALACRGHTPPHSSDADGEDEFTPVHVAVMEGSLTQLRYLLAQ